MSENEKCNEEMNYYRYWLTVSGLYNSNPLYTFKQQLAIKAMCEQLVAMNFRADHNSGHLMTLHTQSRERVREVARRVSDMLMSVPPYSGISFTITTQPLCKSCGTNNPFKSSRCLRCGSTNITPRGYYDPERDLIVFDLPVYKSPEQRRRGALHFET